MYWIDTDVVLALLLKRPPFYPDAFALWQAGDAGRLVRFVSAITPINVFYIARKPMGNADARRIVAELPASVQVCPVDATILQAAHALPLTDYEDAVQIAAARAAGLDALITRNLGDYVGAPLQVFSPADLLKQLPPP
ncbi:MAG: type II toxin-antitoxin system VapC family toxin [Chloroflexaceae bacterium]